MRTIYVLRDVPGGDIRYVGMTREPIEVRLARHIDRAFKELGRWHVHNWIRSLPQFPIIEAIDEVDDETCSLAEQAWIAHFRELGCDLTNMTDGGESGWGPASWEAQARLRADPEWVAAVGAKISAAKKGVPMPAQQREQWSAIMSAAWKGRPKSKAWRESVSRSQKGKPRRRGYNLSSTTKARQSATWREAAAAPVSCLTCRQTCRGLPGIAAHLWRKHQVRLVLP